MAKKHGARQQKKVARQKAKRMEKRTSLVQRTSSDPTIRFRGVEKWQVVEALVGKELWEEGIGYLVIARRESEGKLIFGVFLVDVFCLGVKNAFWDAGTAGDFKELIRKMESTQRMKSIPPAGLAKIVRGAVEFARSFGFSPHPDYRNVAMLLEGIDPADYPQEFTFGRDGKPFYIQGPYETPAEASAILRRIGEAGGEFIAVVPPDLDLDELEFIEDDPEALDQEHIEDR